MAGFFHCSAGSETTSLTSEFHSFPRKQLSGKRDGRVVQNACSTRYKSRLREFDVTPP